MKDQTLAQLSVIVTLAIHLACVQLASAGPLICAWFMWRGQRRCDADATSLAVWVAKISVLSLAVGMVLGLLAGWILVVFQQRQYATALALLSHKMWWGFGELAFYFLCMLGFLAWGFLRPATTSLSRFCHLVLPIVAGTNLMYHFPPLFFVTARIAAAGVLGADPIGPARFRAIVLGGDILSKTMHFWGASFVITGVALMAYGLIRRRIDPATAARSAIGGSRIALVATVIQLPLGVWVLAELPPAVQENALGGDWITVLLLSGSVVIAVILLHHLSHVALGDVVPTMILRSVVLTGLLMLLMVATMYRLGRATHIPRELLFDREGNGLIHQGHSEIRSFREIAFVVLTREE